jgi:hypothetical protein
VSRVTNRVPVDTLCELLEGARACALAYVDPGGAVQALPAPFRWHGGRFLVGLPDGTIGAGTRVALAVDDGWFWWELRAALARGTLTPSERPDASGAPDLAWFELAADRVTAWDYDRLHAEP